MKKLSCILLFLLIPSLCSAITKVPLQYGSLNLSCGTTQLLIGVGLGVTVECIEIDTFSLELDHGLLDSTSLTHDDHSGYLWSIGRSGGQTLIGGIASGDDLTLQSTSHGTKGSTIVVDNLDSQSAREKNEVLIVFGDSPYTVLPTDHIINCDSDGGAIEIDYPIGTSGRELIINGVGASGNDCSLDPNGAEEIFAGGAGVAFVMYDGETWDTRYNATKGWR